MTTNKAESLTPKQAMFVREYLIDMNATAAYQRAGYKTKGPGAEVNACNLLRNPKVAVAVAAAQAERSQRLQLSADNTLRENARLAHSDIRRLFRPDGSLKEIQEWDDDVAAAVASVEVIEETEGQGRNRKVVGHLKKVKLWDKNAALEREFKHQGMFKNEVNGTVNNTTIVVSLEQRRLELREMAAALRISGPGELGAGHSAGTDAGTNPSGLAAPVGPGERPPDAGTDPVAGS